MPGFLKQTETIITGEQQQNEALLYLCGALIAVIMWIAFAKLGYQPYFYGDELSQLDVATKSNWHTAFIKFSEYKPRWISNALIAFLYHNFYHHRGLLTSAGITLQVAGSCCFLITLRRLGVAPIAAVLATLGLVVTRFNIFAAFEVNLGLIEGSANFCFWLSIYFWVTYVKSGRYLHCFACLLAIACAGLCHERYLPLIVMPLIAPLLLDPRIFCKRLQGGIYKYFGPLLGFSIVICISSLLILYAPRSTMLGTGGQPVSLVSHQTIQQIESGFLQIVGINNGPEIFTGSHDGIFGCISNALVIAIVVCTLIVLYRKGWFLPAFILLLLAIASVQEVRWFFKYLDCPKPYGHVATSLLCMGTWTAVIVALMAVCWKYRSCFRIPKTKDNCSEFLELLFPLMALVLLLFAGSISIRQELRWLHQPMAIVILVIACLLWKDYSARRSILLFIICASLSTSSEFWIHSPVFYACASRNTNAVGQLLHDGAFDSASTIIDGGDAWNFYGGSAFFFHFNIRSNQIPSIRNATVTVSDGMITKIVIRPIVLSLSKAPLEVLGGTHK